MKPFIYLGLGVVLLAGCTSTGPEKTLPQTTQTAVPPGTAPAGGYVPGLPPGGMSKTADTSWVTTKYLDLAYASQSGAQKLDLYLPNEGQAPYPVIIEIHGGGFMMGGKSGDIGPQLEALKRGYAVASVNYRHSGEAVFPAAVNDVKEAIKFLRANAGKYRLNPEKFATWGGSAGGNLSALAAVSGGVTSFGDPQSPYTGVSDRVQAAVDWFGPIKFSTMDAEFAALGVTPKMGATSSPSSAESKYLGKTVGSAEAQALVEQASPLSYITPDDPPVMIQHGTKDTNIPITQSKNFAAQLSSVLGQNKVIYEEIPEAAHGGSQFSDPANVKKILDFLDVTLKKP